MLDRPRMNSGPGSFDPQMSERLPVVRSYRSITSAPVAGSTTPRCFPKIPKSPPFWLVDQSNSSMIWSPGMREIAYLFWVNDNATAIPGHFETRWAKHVSFARSW